MIFDARSQPGPAGRLRDHSPGLPVALAITARACRSPFAITARACRSPCQHQKVERRTIKMTEYTDDLKKDLYVTPEMEIIPLDQDDVILTSYYGEDEVH